MRRIAILALVALLPSCSLVRSDSFAHRETLAQVSTIDAILAGDYDGKRTCGELLRYGDLGIGTFHALDGEMIVLDGVVYQVDARGEVFAMPDDARTPFACVTFFEPDIKLEIQQNTTGFVTDLECLMNLVDERADAKNLFLAVRIDGWFTRVKTRSVPAQAKPYPPLVEVTKNQPEFEYKCVHGTIVGFRCPAFVKGINVPGYHLHFITDDRTGGGHVLDLVLDSGEVTIDVTPNFYLTLPAGHEAFQELDLSADRAEELEKVEK